MDDLGSEQICKLSFNKNQQKTNNSAIYYDYGNTTTTNATSTAINESGASVASINITTAAAVSSAANTAVIVGTATAPITTINNGSGGGGTITTTKTKSSPIISGNYDTRFDKQHTSKMLMMKKLMNKKNDFQDDDSDIMNKNSSNSITPISISSGSDSSPEQHHQQQQYNQTMMGATSGALITGYCGGGGDGDVLGGDSFGDDDSDEKEKTDITPENMKKLDDVILASSRCGDRGNNSRRRIEMKSAGVRDGKSRKHCDNVIDGGGGGSGGDDDDDDNNIELKIVEDESPNKQNLAFTIEFSEGESSATAARYKNMVERFQNRHRRGASLSKLDDNHSSNSPIGTPPIAGGRTSRVMSAVNQRQQQKHTGSGSVVSGVQSSETNQNSEANKVKLRIRDRSTSGVRDASKRHSWSPRSSIHEPFETQQQQHLKHREKQKMLKGTNSGNMITSKESVMNYQRQTTTITTRPTDKLHSKIGKKTDMRPSSPHLEGNTKASKTFTPRSTAMQLALNKVEFLCPEPPLDDFLKGKNVEGDDNGDSVSEAGTYTVDGDNYTEEQKEQMNIDKSVGKFTSDQLSDLKIDSAQQIRPSELSLHTTNNNIENQRRTNILEINYYHDSTSLKPKISYLEKIKSRVRNMAKPPDKKLKSPSDVGIFTSVTTSGVLSIKPTLDPNPKVNRRNSLTKSHVDSSEYISADNSFKGCSGANTAADKSPYSSTFTDHQKAEYKLNLFSTTTNQTDSQILNENYSDVDTPITPDSPTNSFSKSVISETGLKTAQTKNDWIQEWARNARARSQSATTTCSKVDNEQMSRSYNFEAVDSIGFGDTSASAMYHNKAIIDRLRSHGIGDLEYSSDPNVSTLKNANITTNNNGSGNVLSTRPPMSPSKIPSPMHSIGRARSVSRTRGSLQDLSPSKTVVAAATAATPTDSTDIYLQKTAAAISNLTQSFSRKNSLQSTATAATKSPPSSSTGNSPRHHIFPQHYSADEYSPTHTKHHYTNHSGHHQHHSTVHKRNLSLDYRNNIMSHSLNTETLTTILGNEKQRTNQSNRPKQHSYDGAGYESPKLFQRKAYIDQTTGCLSSTKQSQPQPQQQSPIRRSSSFSTRPMSNSSSGRQQQASNSSRNIKKSTGPGQNSIQKSASSTSFRKMYSDYDDSVAYYINDEDDLIDAEYCISSDEFDDSDHGECYVPPIPAAESEPSEPLTNTRYNKALLMRIERSKQRVANMQGKPSGGGGVVACPNTPEMPRRAVQSAGQRASIRQSVPRDSSLSRLKAEVPNSLASAKKHLLQTVASSSATSTSTGPASSNTGKKVQPKYMDISKYKPVQSANFLRKDDTKSTLITRSTEIKRSPSSASVALNRNDPTRASNRSVKSLNSRSGSGGSKREPPSASKQKEVELAMWKRRATYDPMKSAAEDRRKKEEAKKLAQSQAKSADSSIVTRSQSFHSGVTLMSSSSSSKFQFHHNHSDFRNNDFNDDDDDENAYDKNYAGNNYDDDDDDDDNDNEDDNNGTENVCIGDKNKQLKKNNYDQEDNEAAATIKNIRINNNNNNNKNFNKYRWSSTESNNKYGRNTIGGCIQGVNDDEEED